MFVAFPVRKRTRRLFQYDGITLVAEYSVTILQRRYVHGSGTDQPILWYEGIAVSAATRRYLMADERGSITSVSDNAGAILAINRYDEYGIPASTNLGRFGYSRSSRWPGGPGRHETQTWLPEIGMWHYRARIYSPTLGRFLQTDPIGYGDGMNLYAYVGGDPVNLNDFTGTEAGDWFLSADAAAHDATLSYFHRRNTRGQIVEWGGAIYSFRLFGTTYYSYTAQALGAHSGTISLAHRCRLFDCSTRAAWHVHNRSSAMSNRDRTSSERRGIPMYMGFNGATMVYIPSPDPDNDDGGVIITAGEDLWTLTDIDLYRERFGPLGTSRFIGYVHACVVGDVDFCTDTEDLLGYFEQTEMDEGRAN